MAKTLTVYLAADLRNFNQGMNRAEGRAKSLSGTMSNLLGPALIGAAAAAGAFATKLAVDGVKAAIEDEASVTKLAKALENLGMAHDTAPIEAYIDSLEQAYGVADTDLRNAYAQLARTTGDVEEANKALAIALDVAAGSSKSLDSVVTALGKAYSGNTGALGKLNTGLDSATIKTGDMAAITQELTDLFGGSAQAQAKTFQGQLDRLKTGAENLTEAFGKGLLGAFQDSESQTGDLVDTMAELEPVMESLGMELGKTAGYITDVIGPLLELNDLLQSTGEASGFADGAINGLRDAVYNTLNVWKPLAGAVNGVNDALGGSDDIAKEAKVTFDRLDTTIDAVGGGILGLKGSLTDLTPELEDNEEAAGIAADTYFDLYEQIAKADRAARDFAGTSGTVSSAIASGLRNPNFTGRDDRFDEKEEKKTRSLTDAYTKQTEAVDKATGKNKQLAEAYREQSRALETTRKDLADAIGQLEEASAKWQDYYESIRQGLAQGVSLSDAYEGQFNREGEKTGVSLLEGFNRQVAHVEWFGNVLKAMQAQGADPAFIQEVAKLGPGIGGALGQQMVTEGLVKTLSEKWVGVQSTINTLAEGLVPTFLTQGIESGTQLVNGLSETLKRQGKRLTALGREIGKPVGAGFSAQIAADVLEAVRAVEAATTAARAERIAQARANAAAVTEQAVAQAIANLVIKNDARQGV
ncbi:MAG: hypothetical protein ACO3IN_10815, partial [Steroidobacteraceae bacterium]